MIDTTSILGYAKPWSVAPGETVSFHLSSAHLPSASLKVVRVRCADPDPNGPGLKLLHAATPLDDGDVQLSSQPTHVGSYASVADGPILSGLTAFSVGCYIYPTIVGGCRQTIVSRWNDRLDSGWKLELDDEGHLSMTVACKGMTRSARSSRSILRREWIFVAGSRSADGTIRLEAVSLSRDGGRERVFSVEDEGFPAVQWPAATPLLFAAQWTGDSRPNKETFNHFNGKIDRPRLYGAALTRADVQQLVETLHPVQTDPLLVGAWDFSLGMNGDEITDLSANNLNGSVHRLPMRAATGANWTGQIHSWTEDPSQYGAIHFHEDDLEDAGWAATTTLSIPDDWQSGFYALQMTTSNGSVPVESYAIFFVRPPRGRRTSDIAVIAPTATYLAYANNHSRLDQTHFEVMADGLMIITADDVYTNEHRELGSSTYDTHSDDSGVCYSTGARPILNARPRSNTFNYVNDTHLLDWLEEMGHGYDVVTDEDMHREGARLLSGYRVVINMTHPEYYSKEMLDALETYQNGGGRHMYLGGNGFYWRVAFHPTKTGIIELRRGLTGLRSWETEAGEGNLSFTGEPSGLWRSSGRAPQRLCGVGFSAQVFDFSTYYRRLPDSFDDRASFVFEGVGADEPIGNFGLRLGGAAGLEIDRAEPNLGSAPNIMILATADRTGAGGIPAPEELPALYRGFTGEENAMVRADMVLYPTSNGGAVFSTGSIAWCCSLSHAGYANNVSQITGNVLNRFLDDSPI
ncbi:N,N-dimethylformamidase [Corticibacterium sp. UT-5YL-CI-8]|nr:N,N-dimethylformamidase [Tianweitania sp. UT-5YL-CI-8]